MAITAEIEQTEGEHRARLAEVGKPMFLVIGLQKTGVATRQVEWQRARKAKGER